MIENIAAIVVGIKEIITSFSFKKFLFWFFSIFIFISTTLSIYEYYTGNFYYIRINNKIDAIVKIDNQFDENNETKESIQEEYSVLIKNLNDYNIDRKIKFGKTIKFSQKSKEYILKLISALIVPLVLVIWGRSGESRKGKSDMLIGAIIIAFIGGFVAMFIPTISKLWINFLGFPVIELVILLIIGSFMD